ncbi:MAG: hypothetical protein EHM93_18345 [Bacteroidales bacterium]|nr:MAG: hypothetical protein EHM93_18345 [Bacteroidales bacterium]
MKKSVLFLFTALVALVFFAACQKEDDRNQKNESSLRFTSVKPNSLDVNEKPFTIDLAGIYCNYLYIGVTYTGGQRGHEFIVAWDGLVQQIGEKKFIDLKVYHKNVGDNGTNQITDSLMLELKQLKISEELMKDKNLYFNVINSSDLSNVKVIQAYIPEDGGTTTDPNLFENVEVEVVSQGDCSKGVFENLWLKNSSNEIFYIPKAVESNINYTPTLNDRLKISFERTWFSDSTIYCSSWTGKQVEVINIKALVKVQ